MPIIDADGCPINVQIDGPENAPVLMLSNSLGTNLHMWDAQVPEFTKHFRVVRYDRRGHGKSGVPKGPYSMERFGRDVLAIIDALKVDKINWCGLSMGGMVGMWLGANASNRLNKMVLSNTNCHYPDKSPWADRIRAVREKGLASFVGLNMERWFTKAFRDSNAAEIARLTEMFVATNPEGYIGCVEAIRDMDHRDLLPKIKVPTLIIAGKDDPATTVAQAEYLRDHIPGAKMVVINAAHISNIERPQEYAKAVLDFLLH
ncbi:MAG TPA: 3-oxoadipate enol-lactonase [Pseudolabrys sp.]|jgi:3-oxoadipate enol-lactonase|nr:3-oxoadipate enol-lactonase [Pseudolabrys sp.]